MTRLTTTLTNACRSAVTQAKSAAACKSPLHASLQYGLVALIHLVDDLSMIQFIAGRVAQELEKGDSSLRSLVSVQGSLAMHAIKAFGSEEQRERWLPRMAAGVWDDACWLEQPTEHRPCKCELQVDTLTQLCTGRCKA